MAKISFPCDGCGSVLSVPDDKAGKQGKCPKCGTIVEVPKPPPQPVTAGPKLATERQINYAVSLGIECRPGMTSKDLSKLITAVEDKRLEKMNELNDRESETYARIQAEVLAQVDEEDCRLSKATPQQMADEFPRRNPYLVAIVLVLDCSSPETHEMGKVTIKYSGNITETNAKTTLFVQASRWTGFKMK